MNPASLKHISILEVSEIEPQSRFFGLFRYDNGRKRMNYLI